MLDLSDFALQEQPEDNLMVAISRAWYNGSYTMTAKPIKSLELHYTMVQSLIIVGFSSKINLLLPTDNSWKDEGTEIPVKMTLIILSTGVYFPDPPISTLGINCYLLPLQFGTKR